mmetsp:Transcript_4725/g.11365  ORF Transcript_4725/g.11365 Transcript_4725/m.11365 type:complete len:204 (+) Transcript_4725:1105-1716(+)
MPAPPTMSMASLMLCLPFSVHCCFMMAESTVGFSPSARIASKSACAAVTWYVLRPMLASFSCTPSISAIGTLNCLRTRAYPPTASAHSLDAATPPAGSEIPRPSPRHSINMFHPNPHRASPPITADIGMNTSSPCTVPFMKPTPSGLCRGPVRSPGMPCGTVGFGSVGRSATVMPSWPTVRSLLGSESLNASPMTVATGASVM